MELLNTVLKVIGGPAALLVVFQTIAIIAMWKYIREADLSHHKVLELKDSQMKELFNDQNEMSKQLIRVTEATNSAIVQMIEMLKTTGTMGRDYQDSMRAKAEEIIRTADSIQLKCDQILGRLDIRRR